MPPSQSSCIPPAAGPFQHFPAPQFPPTAQAPPLRTSTAGQPVLSPPIPPPAGQAISPPFSLRPHPQVPSVPMGYTSQSVNFPAPGGNFPQSSLDSPFPGLRQTLQPSFPGYPSKLSNAVPQSPPMQSPFPSYQGGYVTSIKKKGGYVPAAAAPHPPLLSHQGGYVSPPPVSASLGLHSREQIHHPGAAQGLIEDFSSLSLGSVPGSMDPGVDIKAFPRPLEGDVEPNSVQFLASILLI